MNRWSKYATAAQFMIVLLLFSSCGQPQVRSRWLDREIVVDGADTEWEGALFLLEQARATLGVMNDGDHLYLTLGLTDQEAQRQILGEGLTLWFDPKGKKNRTYAVRFPGAAARMAGSASAERAIRAMANSHGPSPEVEILGPETGESHLGHGAEAPQARIRLSYEAGRLVYEARISLDWIAQRPPGTVGLGLELARPERHALLAPDSGSEGGILLAQDVGGSLGHGGGGGGGGGRAIGGPPEQGPSASLKIWLRVLLAPGPVQAAAGQSGA